MLTEEIAALDDIWPEVATRLQRWLEGRGVNRATAEDTCQETAMRVVASGVAYRDAPDLLRWARVVAWRVFLDGCRRDRRLTYDMPERDAGVDVAAEVVGRLRVASLSTQFPHLADAEQAALLGTDVGRGRPEQARLAKRRQRARQHLLTLMDGVAAFLLWLHRRMRVNPAETTAALAAPLLLVVALAALPHVSNDPAHASVTAARAAVRAPADTGASQLGGAAPVAARGTAPVAAPPRPNSRELRAEVAVPTPLGDASVGTRPKEPDDHFICTVELLGLPQQCVDLPIHITG